VFSLAIADLDHFKDVNDTYSHETGDEVLKGVAEVFRAAVRTPDVVARYGGEEFLLLFPESSLSEAERACEKIRIALLEHPWTDIAPGLKVTASFGVAYSADADNSTALIAMADRNLYAAKREGRNRVRAASAS
jgi:diguanylate cyclase (GGDEF)-like protein